MKLIDDETRKRIPGLYFTQDDPDPVAQVKFFTPWSGWTWYATEFDGVDTFFGYVIGLEAEWGYFSLSELESVRGPGGVRIERDLYFTPQPMSEILARR